MTKKEFQSNRGKVEWLYSTSNKVVSLPVVDILIMEKEHLQCKKIDFNGMLQRVRDTEDIAVPIAVKRIEGSGKYSLVMGLSRLTSAKLISITSIKCVVTDLNHSEFRAKYLKNAIPNV